MSIEVIDDLLREPEPTSLENFLIHRLDWKYIDNKDIENGGDDLYDYQFIHMFFQGGYASNFYREIEPIVRRFPVLAVHRVKANLEVYTGKQSKGDFHFDWLHPTINMPTNNMMTAIYYVNSNNGYTEFEDGTKVDSVRNRIVTFPSNMKHRGVSQTDTRTRMVINFNWFVSQI